VEETIMDVVEDISLSVVLAAAEVKVETAGGKVTIDDKVGTSTVI